MKSLGIILFKLLFLLDFCFKNYGFSVTQLANFDDCLTTSFVIITFFKPILSVCFLQLKQYDDNIFLTTYFKAFDFIE